MPLRKFFLRMMLGSLGVAAAAGASAVFLAGHELVWRVVLTGIATAIACGLLLAVSMMVDREKSRPAGMLGMAGVIAEFLICLILIWGISPRGDSLMAQFALTALAIFLAVPPAMLFLRLATPTRDPGALLGVGLCATCFLMALVGTWFPFDGVYDATEKWWSSAGLTAGFGFLIVCCLAGFRTHRRPWRWIGIAANFLAAGITIFAIWKDLHGGSGLLACVIGLAVVIAHANLALLVPLRPGQQWVRIATVGAVGATSLFIDVDAIRNDLRMDDLLGRLGQASAIIAGCGSLALLVLAKINRKPEPPVASEVKAVAIVCPNCQKKLVLPVGGAACPGCGLKIHIRVEEPRCQQCEYLLYGINSDRCPECGTPIAKSDAVFAQPQPSL